MTRPRMTAVQARLRPRRPDCTHRAHRRRAARPDPVQRPHQRGQTPDPGRRQLALRARSAAKRLRVHLPAGRPIGVGEPIGVEVPPEACTVFPAEAA